MSGTSMDGIDAALVQIEGDRCKLLATHTQQYPEDLTERLRLLAAGEDDVLHNVALADREVGQSFALAAARLLESSQSQSQNVRAIGSHGQTVRHYPPGTGDVAYTVQIGDPSAIAEFTGITTIADFRRQDIAAGGEGAPLAPAFHAAQFGTEGIKRAIVNIGGISNATLLDGTTVAAGFDCGPGNTLLDAWIKKNRGDNYDAHGAWSAEHTVLQPLLTALCEDKFFARSGPRSTGVEHFNIQWLEAQLNGAENPGDVQATLAELTAYAISDSLERCDQKPSEVFVCGGGARNADLMRRLNSRLSDRGVRLGTTDELGLASEWVEASAWAWLAYRHLVELPGNIPPVTGATGPRILGARYLAVCRT